MRLLRPTLTALTPLRAWLLALLLLAAQSAGLSHRLAHAGPAGAAGTAAAQAVWSPEHQQGTPDCRLIDQLAHADALCGPALAPLPTLPVVLLTPAMPALQLQVAPRAVYQARAPPALERV